jgi:nitrite reductase/ring-hydroxylating ferredoxin subunit
MDRLPADSGETTLDRMIDHAIGAVEQPDNSITSAEREVRQAARAVRATLEVLAEALTYRETDGTATGWRTISGEQLAALAVCVHADAPMRRTVRQSQIELLDRDAARIACGNARLGE